jgi:uncharacterized protein
VELEHRFTVPTSVADTWEAFNDLERIAPCFPGATLTSAEGDEFAGSVKVRLGPISLLYKGTGRFVERDAEAHHALIEAKGKDKRGNGTAAATVRAQLSPDGEQTAVEVVTDLAITGKPAQFGRGVIQDVSDKLLGQFVACLETRLAGGAPVAPGESGSAEPAPAAAAEPAAAPAAEPAAEPAAKPAAPPPAPPPSTRGSDEALNLGSTVLPVLVKSYWKQAAAALVVIAVIVWLIARD